MAILRCYSISIVLSECGAIEFSLSHSLIHSFVHFHHHHHHCRILTIITIINVIINNNNKNNNHHRLLNVKPFNSINKYTHILIVGTRSKHLKRNTFSHPHIFFVRCESKLYFILQHPFYSPHTLSFIANFFVFQTENAFNSNVDE